MNDRIDYKHAAPIQIRFNDIDGQLHVNNAVYQSYFDIGREDYFTVISGENYQPGGQSVVIASVNVDFIKPVLRYDKIQVETAVVKIGNKSLTMQQRISGIYDGEIKAECRTVFAGFDYDSQSTIPITDEMRECIENFEEKSFPVPA